MKRIVILHGNGQSTGSSNWYPYIKQGLKDFHIDCLTLDLPDAKLARKEYWFPYFRDVLKLGADDIIIGHSSGAVAIMKYAENNKIGASVLVLLTIPIWVTKVSGKVIISKHHGSGEK